jgi:hypothetical protein
MKPPLPRFEGAVPRTLDVQLEIAKAIRALLGPVDDKTRGRRRAEIAAIRRDLEALACDLPKAFAEAATLAKAELWAALKKYSPNQPRVLAGNPDGGQWTKTDGGAASAAFADQSTDDGPKARQYAQLVTDTQTDAAANGDNPYRQSATSAPILRVNDIPPSVGLTATLERLVATGRISAEEAAEVQQSANAVKAQDTARLTAAIESITVREAQSVLSSEEFAELRAAYLAGKETTVSIGGRTIQYEPNIPPYISGMTNFKGNGFAMGPGAFASPQETQATVLQELYRLNTSESAATGVFSGESVASENAAARAFADKIVQSGVMDR